jgi:AcrR family transcriptional regulator
MSARDVKPNGAPVVQTERQGAHVEEMQRRRLLSAIGELLGEDGLESASVGSICKRAGVSRRTFYEVFDDREQCFLAAFNHAVERIALEVVPAYGGDGPMVKRGGKASWSARVRAALCALLEHFDAHPGVARMCVVETLRGAPEVLERRRRVLAGIAGAVDEGSGEARNGNGPLPLTAEGVVGGALAVIHARLCEADPAPLAALANPLTAMIVHPYLGSAVARRELERPAPKPISTVTNGTKDPFKGLSIRFTYRTARVLATIAAEPGASNRLIAETSGITDEGQMSRLLRRLEAAGLIENLGEGHIRGEPNAWWLTDRGEAIHTTFTGTETGSAG